VRPVRPSMARLAMLTIRPFLRARMASSTAWVAAIAEATFASITAV